jgi:tetratricopeptide (TPR) repeat protein
MEGKVRNNFSYEKWGSAEAHPRKEKSVLRWLALSLVFLLLNALPMTAGAAANKEDIRKKRHGSVDRDPITPSEKKSEEQAIENVLTFVRNYHNFSGSQAVLENVSDLTRLEKFLHDYKLLNAQALSDESLLRKLQIKIYEELVGYLRSYDKVAEAAAVQRKLVDASPSDRRLRLDLANLLGESPQGHQEATSIYLRLREENPEDLDALTGLARLQVAKQEFAEALKNYEQLLKVRPQDLAFQLEYARLLARLNRHEEAAAHLNQIAGASPDFYSAKLELARVQAHLGHIAQAEEQLRVLAQNSKLSLELKKEVHAIYRELLAQRDDLPLRRQYAQAFSQDKRTLDLSIAEYREILKSGRADQNDRLALARVLSWNKNYEEALGLYRELSASDPSSQAILAEMADILRWAGRYSEAIAIINRQLDLQPQSVEYKLAKARILNDTKNYDESMRLYQEVIQANPNQPAIRLEYARTLNWSGKSEQACKEYEQIVALTPSAEVYLEYARALTIQHRYAESNRIYRKLLEERPDDRAIRLEYAQTLAWRNDLKAAQQQFIDAMKDFIDSRKTFAKVLFWHGKYEEARAEFLSLLNLKPNDNEMRFDAARALVRLEQFEEAINELEQLRAELPNNKEVAEEYKQAVELKKTRALDAEKAAKEEKIEDTKSKSKTISQNSGPDSQSILIEPIKSNAAPSEEELRALEKSKELLEKEPENDKLRLELANQMLWSKHYREAIKMYQAILADDPGEMDAQVGLAEALLYTDDYGAAYKIFNTVLAEDPANVRARFGRAQIYAYGSKVPDYHNAFKELKQILALSFTHVPAWETYRELGRELNPTVDPVSQGLYDSDKFSRFSAGFDYRYPLNSQTALTSSYRYHSVYQPCGPALLGNNYADWLGKHWTGRSYSFGVKQRLASNAQLQATVGGTNFNGGLSFIDASVALDVSLRRSHLVSVSYERQPGILFMNTIFVLGAGLYGDRFQLAHNYQFRGKWEFSQSYRFTHLSNSRPRDRVPDNMIKEVRAAILYKVSKDFSLGAVYSFLGFHNSSPLYYSPRAQHTMGGEFSYQKSNKRIGVGLYGSVGKLFTGQVNGFYATAKTDVTFHFSEVLKLDLSYQPLYSRAGSVFGSHNYRYHTFAFNLRYLWNRNRYRI